ncbi:MAG: riboflavin biosynthesis protein RibF, partial [Candidatus Aminicenantes bacterium]|nr:riboflavin biosynthesis protein RibF [Candidatus Aminicenantes bacterium]
MQIIRRIEDFPALTKNTVAAIGNFDGIHLGHKKILQFLAKEAKKHNLFSLVLTFSPHPERYLGKKPVKMIQTMDQRLKEIEKSNIDKTLVLPFNEDIANLSSRKFIQNIMIDKLHAAEIIVGENFRFGKNRTGSVRILHKLSNPCGFKFFSISSEKRQGLTVSSSLIRTLLLKGAIKEANALLGHPYVIEGSVISGHSRGKSLGFPTANISTDNEIIPSGIYFSFVFSHGQKHPALTNIGTSPTFGLSETQIESHLIDFSENLYGQVLKIQLLKKFRTEIKFSTPEQLV